MKKFYDDKVSALMEPSQKRYVSVRGARGMSSDFFSLQGPWVLPKNMREGFAGSQGKDMIHIDLHV